MQLIAVKKQNCIFAINICSKHMYVLFLVFLNNNEKNNNNYACNTKKKSVRQSFYCETWNKSTKYIESQHDL